MELRIPNRRVYDSAFSCLYISDMVAIPETDPTLQKRVLGYDEN